MKDTYLLTGANRGLGLALTRSLLADGHRVIATCRDPGSATALATASDTGSLEILPLDVVCPDSIEQLADVLAERPLDVLVNNAGIMDRHDNADEMDYDAWMKTFAVNTLAPFRLANRLRPNLSVSRHPRVVTVSSQMGSITRGGTGSIAYRSSKAAVNRAMRSLADEWSGDGFTVVVVHPGWVRTDMGGGEATLSPRESAADLTKLMAGLTLADNGRFLNHDGSSMPW